MKVKGKEKRGEADGCKGPIDVLCNGDLNGHTLVRKSGFVVCRTCGFYAASLSRKLREACPGPRKPKLIPNDAKRAQRRDRILAGIHPLTGKPVQVISN